MILQVPTPHSPSSLQWTFQAGLGAKSGFFSIVHHPLLAVHTVDGRNPAPLGMYKNPVNSGINCLSTGAGFLPSTVPHESTKYKSS